MLKSDILKKLGLKHQNLSESDIEQIFNIFIKKIVYALKDGKNVELRGFGTMKKKRLKYFKGNTFCVENVNYMKSILKFFL